MPEEEKTETVPMQTMPALALRGLTVYPKMMVHFDVGREASVKAIEESMSSNQPIFLVAQKDIRVEEPDRNHLFAMGTVSVVRQILRLPGKTIRVMVEGQIRARLHELTQTDPYLVAQVEPVETSEHYEGKTNSLRAEAAIRQAYELFDRYSELSPKNASAEMLMNIMSSEDAGYIADFLAQNVSMRVLDKQSILDELRPVQRLNKMNRLLRREVEILEMEQSIQRRVQENMTQNQKDAFLREQVRVIQEELGEDGDNELAAYRRQIADAKLPEEVETKLLKEVMHLEKQPFGSAEASVLRNYLDVCLELPWSKDLQGEGQRPGGPEDSGRGPLRPGKGEGADSGVSGGQAAGPGSEGADPLPGGPSGRGKDLHCNVHGPGTEPENGSNFLGRRP